MTLRWQYCYNNIVMITTVAMTNNWQIHLPLSIREAIGIDRAMQFLASVKNGVITLRPKKNEFSKFYGAFQSRKKLDLTNLREQIDYGNL